QQHEPVKRLVAVKLIKAGMDSRQVLARFEAERQALALMDHPHIAKVLDAGATPDGRPFFVMELVKGVPLTRYCDEQRLTPRQRLELFLPVCQAIQHAHQKGIIHRDVKPSNVLVALYDGKPVPKVIDFGVAKATSEPLTERTAQTGFGTVVGTLEYMSPEQASFNPLDIDTRSDIYSLGVLLYELLTGSPPFGRRELEQAGLLEMLRVIREQEPQRPSARLNTAEGLPALAANRGTEPAKLTRLVRGELDWIVMKALDKDRSRRYETANGFALDVQRYLADEPVLACPPSRGYRLRKFVRRNRAQLAVAAALGLLLLGVGAFAWHSEWQATQRWTDAENRKRDELARLGRDEEAVGNLLDQCEDALRADRTDQAALTLEAAERRAADGGAEELAGRLARCRADLTLLRELDAIEVFSWTWVGDRYPGDKAAADRWRDALAAYGVTADRDRAREAARRVNGSLLRDRVLTALDLWLAADKPAGVRAVLQAADPEPYRDAFRDALAVWDRQKMIDLAGRPEALTQPTRFAAVLGELPFIPADRRRAVLQSALRARPGDLALLMALGNSYPNDGREGTTERVRWFQAAVAAHPRNVAAHNELGTALRARGDREGAIACYQVAIRFDQKFANAHFNLACALWAKGNLDGAIASFKEVISLNPKDAEAHCNLGDVLDRKGDPAGAILHFKKATDINRKYVYAYKRLGAVLYARRDLDGAIAAFWNAIQHAKKDALAHNDLAVALRDNGELEKAIKTFRDAIKFDPKLFPPRLNLGLALHAKGDPDGAIEAFRQAIRIKPDSPSAHDALGNALSDQGKPGEAEAAYRKAIDLKPDAHRTHYRLGDVLSRQGKKREAAAAYRKAIDLKPDDDNAYNSLGVVLRDLGRFEEAAAAHREAIRLKPDDPVAHTNLGVDLWELKRLKEAEAALRKAIDLKPDFSLARSNLGVVLWEQRRFKEAEAACREAIRLQPDFFLAHNTLGLALAGQRRLDDAIAAYRQAIDLKPDYHEAHHNLGNARAGQQRLDDAIAAYREAIRIKPDYHLAHYMLGNALSAQRKLGEAEAAFRQAIRIKPDYFLAHLNLGIALLEQGKPKEAAAALRQAIDLKPDDPVAHNNLGNALLEQGKLGEAEAAYREAIRVQPDYPWAYKNLGAVLRRQGRPDEAFAAYRQAIDLKPDYYEAYISLGAALGEQGKLGEAEAAFRQAVRVKPDSYLAHFNLGQALRARGKLDGAIAAYRDALRINPNDARAHDSLAWLLATGPERVRDAKRAVAHATRACELTAWKIPEAIATLAAAHAEAGDFNKAVMYQKKALSFPDFEKANGKGGRERLDLYERKMPYRDPALAPRKVAPPPGEAVTPETTIQQPGRTSPLDQDQEKAPGP
ncbi:MAG: tetratricopeptide repeat protein, partial [Gemmataceae bacterium]|nr:tetratricopeptide repeat protein [Gemmataceae bacterium]